MSIIGSINSRAKLIKNRMKINDENTYDLKPEKLQSRSSSNIQTQRDPLQDISIEYSNDSGDKKGESKSQLDESQIDSAYSGLDQTIIIGDMEESTTSIFDDLKISTSKKQETVTISKEDLQELVDNLKLRHRAEIDAIMIEQCTYKRII